MKGGYDTGFNRVTPVSYKTRLFHIVGEKKQIAVNEIGLKRGNLNSEDVFVVDCGLRIYQVNFYAFYASVYFFQTIILYLKLVRILQILMTFLFISLLV